MNVAGVVLNPCHVIRAIWRTMSISTLVTSSRYLCPCTGSRRPTDFFRTEPSQPTPARPDICAVSPPRSPPRHGHGGHLQLGRALHTPGGRPPALGAPSVRFVSFLVPFCLSLLILTRPPRIDTSDGTRRAASRPTSTSTRASCVWGRRSWSWVRAAGSRGSSLRCAARGRCVSARRDAACVRADWGCAARCS